MATVAVTVTVADEDGDLLEGATVDVFDASGAKVGSGATNSSGVYSASIITTDPTPAPWRCRATLADFYKASGFLIFTDATTASQYFYLFDDIG